MTDNKELLPCTTMTTIGFSYCQECNTWPARWSKFGLHCSMCYARKVCEVNSVPLPTNAKMLADIKFLTNTSHSPDLEK